MDAFPPGQAGIVIQGASATSGPESLGQESREGFTRSPRGKRGSRGFFNQAPRWSKGGLPGSGNNLQGESGGRGFRPGSRGKCVGKSCLTTALGSRGGYGRNIFPRASDAAFKPSYRAYTATFGGRLSDLQRIPAAPSSSVN